MSSFILGVGITVALGSLKPKVGVRIPNPQPNKNLFDFLKKLMLNSNLDQRYLDIVDEKIVEEGIKIYNYRKKYIDEIK